MTDNHGKKAPSAHKIISDGREKLSVSGVLDVSSFDERVIVAETERGSLTVKGENLRISVLTLENGTLGVEGRIDSLVYSDGPIAKSLFGKIFR